MCRHSSPIDRIQRRLQELAVEHSTDDAALIMTRAFTEVEEEKYRAEVEIYNRRDDDSPDDSHDSHSILTTRQA